MKNKPELSCANCNSLSCNSGDKKFPSFCLTEATDPKQVTKLVRHYRGKNADGVMARAAAEIEGLYYGKATRVEETILFAKRIGVKRIGIASCVGLAREARMFAKIVRAKGLDPYMVVCKVGAVDKCDIGIPDEMKVQKGAYDAICNPILQAQKLNTQKTGLNVIVGLCVGHDSLFTKYSNAPVTTLIAKDRVTGHNPVGALYTSHNFYARLLKPD